jgi:hypothetical protein
MIMIGVRTLDPFVNFFYTIELNTIAKKMEIELFREYFFYNFDSI